MLLKTLTRLKTNSNCINVEFKMHMILRNIQIVFPVIKLDVII